MMLRICLLLVGGVLPLGAQAVINNGDKLYKPPEPAVAPAAPNGVIKLQPGVNPPPDGVPPPAPLLPAAPIVHPRMTDFTVSPTTFRDGMVYTKAIKTTVTLNVPATHDLHFHVLTSDPVKVTCTDIIVGKGHLTADGGIRIIWAAVHHNCEIQVKAFADEDPDNILHGRMYLRIKLQ